MSKRSVELQSAGNLAELTLTSKSFRKANNEPYLGEDTHLSISEVESHAAARNTAESIIFDAFKEKPRASDNEQYWEMQRNATLVKLGGVSLGSFSNYFTRLPSDSTPATESDYVYDDGASEVVYTNTQINRLNESNKAPLFFLEEALAKIEYRASTKKDSVGPENYATSLKFFSDKYNELDENVSIDQDTVKLLVNRGLEGFVAISEKDAPNPIELTNVLSVIRSLPAGTVNEEYVAPLLKHVAILLPDFTPKASGTFMRALPKLPLKENGETAAEILNLMIRKNKQFDTVHNFRDTVRSISVLPKTVASDHALAAFFEHRNGLESVLDLESADEVMHRFRTIADDVVGTNQLHIYLKGVAATAGKSALARVKDGSREGIYSQAQFRDVQQTLQRIKANFDAI